MVKCGLIRNTLPAQFKYLCDELSKPTKEALVTDKMMTDLILKILIDERDLVSLPYDRLNALAAKIGHALANHGHLIGSKFAENLERADDLFTEADRLNAQGHIGEAMAVLLEAEDLSLESNS